jgi:hypothetical protein
VVARNDQAVVVRGPTRIYGCLRGQRPRYLVARRVVSHVTLRGHYVAYVQALELYNVADRVVVDDLRGRTRLASYPSGPALAAPLALDERGRVAWFWGGELPRLQKMDHDGEEQLDSGPTLVPASLRVDGISVRWRNGDAERSFAFDLHPPCSLAGSTTLERTSETRIYWIKASVFGCFLPTERRTFIGEQPSDTFEYLGGGHIHAAAHFATIDEGSAGRGGASTDLKTFDLSTGAVAHRWLCCMGADAQVLAAVVGPSGATAWTDYVSPRNTARSVTEVRASDARGEAVVLDSDRQFRAIDTASLRLDGPTISWVHNGEIRTAELR